MASAISYSPLKYEDGSLYPWWGEMVGWFLALASMLQVPLVAIFLIFREKGTLGERIETLLRPKVNNQFRCSSFNYLFRYLHTFTDENVVCSNFRTSFYYKYTYLCKVTSLSALQIKVAVNKENSYFLSVGSK